MRPVSGARGFIRLLFEETWRFLLILVVLINHSDFEVLRLIRAEK
jgi:hypothetical protein